MSQRHESLVSFIDTIELYSGTGFSSEDVINTGVAMRCWNSFEQAGYTALIVISAKF